MILDPSLLALRAANATLNIAATMPHQQQCTDIDHCRTLQSIIHTCLSTIFLCTWAALHLNVPEDPENVTPLRHLWFMLGALVGPEVVLSFALGDWSNGSAMLEKILGESMNQEISP